MIFITGIKIMFICNWCFKEKLDQRNNLCKKCIDISYKITKGCFICTDLCCKKHLKDALMVLVAIRCIHNYNINYKINIQKALDNYIIANIDEINTYSLYLNSPDGLRCKTFTDAIHSRFRANVSRRKFNKILTQAANDIQINLNN